jgi:hypothetical protein
VRKIPKQLLDVKAFFEGDLEIPTSSTSACEVDDRIIAWEERTVGKWVVRTKKIYNSHLHNSE